jgi:hypothetical protein
MMVSDWSFREWTRKSIEEVIHQYYLNKYGDKVYPAMFGVDLWSLLADNLSLDTDPGHTTFGKWKIKTDGPAYTQFIFDTQSPEGKPFFFIPIFELKSGNKIFTPSQWEGDYDDYKCIVKDVTFGMHNYGDETVTPFTLQCLVVYAKGANPNPYSNPLIFDNPLPKMGKKWKYKNENAYVRNNSGELKVAHCTIESELTFKFDDVNNDTLLDSEYTKVTIPSMISAGMVDPYNHIVGAMILNPQFGNYPTLNGKHFNGIPSFGSPNTILSDYTFNCNIPDTVLDSASSYQNPLYISYVESDDFRLHFSSEFNIGFWGYSLGLPLYDTHYTNVIAEMRYQA